MAGCTTTDQLVRIYQKQVEVKFKKMQIQTSATEEPGKSMQEKYLKKLTRRFRDRGGLVHKVEGK
ncbi:hypothetical protein M3P05_19365 [Sansalvadorimonas sp. 2012CJ34-2]|uniref:Uncharacterized protein n=1 Tax=Parendozoicomonas callyspongiae TaxID=2942213 RepID=A0ABT0PL39_9GAMM|nr:hypothetical protein [Sansalvadorimonas sp. 2012CJ34-2]MCL6272085.1 hypothetical protein [Sansalvadorimonas sp. 2012CJ34-2]